LTVLPDTGGPLLPLLVLGVLAFGLGGILLLRRLNP
jgi:LPXTG-motif cell wall-anchored protein